MEVETPTLRLLSGEIDGGVTYKISYMLEITVTFVAYPPTTQNSPGIGALQVGRIR